jgi:hypothetical protein
MTAAAGNAAWTALLPEGTIWLAGRRRSVPLPADMLSAQPVGASVAIAAPPWALHGRPRIGDPRGTRAYIAVPSRQRPLLVASDDPEVLRYLADSVLSVPPGLGPALSLVLTIGLRLLRHRAIWILVAALRAASVVIVRRPG